MSILNKIRSNPGFVLPFIIFYPFFTGWWFSPKSNTDIRETTESHFRYADQIQPAVTGGFGEQACNYCHFDNPVNSDKAKLNIQGIPDSWQSHQSYPITIQISRPDLGKAGFQLTARFQNGQSAGTFQISGNRLTIQHVDSSLVDYLNHTAEGTQPLYKKRTSWNFKWIAPSDTTGAIIWNIAANAANGDQSNFGDYIYLKEVTIQTAMVK